MTSNPVVSEIQTIENGELTFNIRNVDVSIINGLRRACQSNIDSLVFRGFPHHESNIDIKRNTTKFHNEYLKHRLQCIPIHLDDTTVFENYIESYKIRLHKKNTSLSKVFVTTNDFVVIDKKTDDPVSNSRNHSTSFQARFYHK